MSPSGIDKFVASKLKHCNTTEELGDCKVRK